MRILAKQTYLNSLLTTETITLFFGMLVNKIVARVSTLRYGLELNACHGRFIAILPAKLLTCPLMQFFFGFVLSRLFYKLKHVSHFGFVLDVDL